MLGMYLTTAFIFLTAPTPKTMTEGMTGIWTGRVWLVHYEKLKKV
ncbi:hypothetical protein [Spiroplasma sp. ChiS]|nr:hypothetical protein [Spiroplasma sp. ChiS]